jgi:hypothetical protein
MIDVGDGNDANSMKIIRKSILFSFFLGIEGNGWMRLLYAVFRRHPDLLRAGLSRLKDTKKY